MSEHKFYRRPKISIDLFYFFFQRLWKQLGQITTAGFPDRSTRENSVELYHENTAVAVLVLPLTAATRENVSQGISMSCSSACGSMSNTVLKVDYHVQSLPVLNWKTGQNPKYFITDHYYLEAVLTLYKHFCTSN